LLVRKYCFSFDVSCVEVPRFFRSWRGGEPLLFCRSPFDLFTEKAGTPFCTLGFICLLLLVLLEVITLSVCLALPAVEVVFVFAVLACSPSEPHPMPMDTTLKGMRAHVRDFDVRGQKNNWGMVSGEGLPGRVLVMHPSHEVLVLAPYAEASVTVNRRDKAVRRRCALCLN